MPASQFFYCLASNSNTSLGTSLYTGASGANGDVYCTGALQLQGNDTVNGDVEATGTVNQNGASVSGLVSSNTIPIPLPAPMASNYSSISLINLLNFLFGNNINGESFLSSYEVVYCLGNTTLKGTLSGKGIIFVNGNLNISGNLNYSSPTDEAAIIVTGNVNFFGGVSSIVGYWYCGGTFSAPWSLTLTRGCIVANALTTSGNLTATYDPIIWNTPGEAYRMKLPGFWP
jgi:cytoskeletal protein CcmA (bactofilin family)